MPIYAKIRPVADAAHKTSVLPFIIGKNGSFFMLTIFIRAFVLYIIMALTLRAMGKHQLGQYQPYELAMAFIIADIVSTPMSDVSTPIAYGILPVAALYITHSLITLLCMKFDRVRAIVSGKPAVIVSNCGIDAQELKRLCLGISDVLEGLRIAGILDPKELGTAIVESNGTITAFPKSSSRPPTAEELGVSAQPQTLPLMLVLQGRIQPANLKKSGKDEVWLNSIFEKHAVNTGETLLASLGADGEMRVQDMTGRVVSFKALGQEEVVW